LFVQGGKEWPTEKEGLKVGKKGLKSEKVTVLGAKANGGGEGGE